jgi:hypothetical protein
MHGFPRLRWLALGWLAVYLPAYTLAYGLANFLFLCNLTVFLAAVGLWTGSRLLLSSQAVAMVMVGLLWTADLVSRLVTGAHLIGGTEYMWEPQWPLFTRLLSLYHVVLPVLLVVVLRRIGYDRRGYLLQSVISLVAVSLGRLFGPEPNINHAFVDPILKRTWGGAATHIGVIVGALVLVVYPATHLLLERLCPGPTSDPLARAREEPLAGRSTETQELPA